MNGSVVVTGGANGIGRATSRQLSRAGWAVLAVDRDEQALDELTTADGPSVRGLAGDLTDPTTVQRVVAAARQLGPLSGWVNNAGILTDRPLHEMDDALIDQLLAINLRATILGTRAAVQTLLAAGRPGAIVNVSSIHARHPFPGHPVYAAAKGAVEALTRQICVEYAGLGIRCNAVAPGAVATRMTVDPAAGDTDTARQLAAAAALSPADRVSSPVEIAEVIEFLMSDRSRSINGHVLAADNGMSARGREPYPAGSDG
jgi:NAD(P)-dependent dehydrogenase (short-subunit alcohol dehydrogenase family)